MKNDSLAKKMRPPVFVRGDLTIDEAAKVMISKKISSILIVREHEVIGILTERDIVRKIVTLDVDQRLSHKVNTVMSRPLQCIRQSAILEDIANLHRQKGFRHFPVVVSIVSPLLQEHIIGMLTITDLGRTYLESIR